MFVKGITCPIKNRKGRMQDCRFMICSIHLKNRYIKEKL